MRGKSPLDKPSGKPETRICLRGTFTPTNDATNVGGNSNTAGKAPVYIGNCPGVDSARPGWEAQNDFEVQVIGALASIRLKDSLVSTFMRRPPWWEDLADPSHPSRAIEITEAIIDQFVEVARKRGTRPIVSF